jgi:hypothetical protein
MEDEAAPGPEASGEAGADQPPPTETEEGEPTEEELRAQIEEGLRKVRVHDVVLESTVTILNLTARRIAKADERDLDQARTGIEAVRALSGLLEPEPQAQVRNALAELQVLYARHAGGEPAPPTGEGGEPDQPAGSQAEQGRPAPGQAPPGLWVPPGA